MRTMEEARTKVESRVTQLKQDCAQGVVPEPYCSNGRNWYTDNVLAKFNGWLTSAEGEITASESLDNLSAYETDLRRAVANGDSFSTWVDGVHRAFTQSGGGALGGPPIGEIADVAIKVVTAAWKEYRAGQMERISTLKEQMELQRFRSFDSIT